MPVDYIEKTEFPLKYTIDLCMITEADPEVGV